MPSPSNTVHLGDVAITILSNSNELTVSELVIPASSVASVHHHPHEEVNYVLAGKLVFMCDGETKTLGPGDVIRIPPNKPHNITCCPESDGRVISVWAPSRKDLIDKLK